MIVARAPGKAILAGEYAVLHGAPAIVVAVDRTARAWLADGRGTAQSPFTVAALERAAAWLGSRGLSTDGLLQSGALGVDSSALYVGALKIGLGSSAAVTVATLGAALASRGVDIVDNKSDTHGISREELFALADEAHAAAQGTRGSGIDIATAIWGGALRFRRGATAPEISSVKMPDRLELTFVFTGQSASTGELVGKVNALATRDPVRHRAAIERLTENAARFAEALVTGDLAGILAAADAYNESMAALGRAADAPIVTPALAKLAALARRAGGAAKPSGAGGGDLGICFTTNPDSTARLRALVSEAGDGLQLVSLSAPSPGLSFVEESQR
jgi:phosphomevalonate kinase